VQLRNQRHVAPNRPRVLALGTFQPEYPRNALTQAGLRALGCPIDTLNVPVWDRLPDRLAPARRWRSLASLGVRLLRAYATLLVRLPRRLARVDVVLVGYPGHLDMLALGPFVRLSRRRLIFDPLVTLTDTLVEDRRLIPPGGMRARAIRLLDQVALRLAHVVLADTEENAQYMRALAPSARSRIVVVPVGADEELFSPARALSSPGWPARAPEALRVLFYGTFIPLHGPETIVRAAALLGPERASFVLIGQGQLAGETQALARALDLQNACFLPWVPYRELPAWIATADVVLGIFGDTAKAARVVPNKVYQAMAMGAAIITRDSPAVRRVLEHERSAFLVPPADPAALASAIEALNDHGLRSRLGTAARQAFLQLAMRQALAERLHDALLDSRSPARMLGVVERDGR